jgi:hypothetical protein
MTVATSTILVARKPADLDTLVAAAILAGKQPSGNVFNDAKGNLCQVMITSGADQVAYAADGALSNAGVTAILTKGSAGAYTLAAPTADGVRMRIINGSAFAHVVTATNLIDDGVTGGAKDTMTFGAFVGAGIDLESYGGHWCVIGKNVVTIAGS